MKEHKREDFRIDHSINGYFILLPKNFGQYLHKNGCIESTCGLKNFFETYKDAQECLDKYFPAELNLPKGFPPLPKIPSEYKFIDRGWGWKPERACLFVVTDGEGDDCWSYSLDNQSRPSGIKDFYYVEIVKKYDAEDKLEKSMTLEEQIKFAKSLVGKKVKNRVGNDYVEILNFTVETKTPANMHDMASKECDYILKAQDVVVVINGYSYSRPIKPDSKFSDFEIQKEVKVNGFVAEDMGDYYKFGCAIISKAQLKLTKEFILESKGVTKYNREVKSVKIGAGEFTLEILNQLV